MAASRPPRLLCVAPAPAIDRLEEVERLVPGRIHRPLAGIAVAGGKGLNVARAARLLGADVVVATMLGGHAGRWIEAQLREAGIEVRATVVGGETRTCLSILSRADGMLTELYPRAERVLPADWEAFRALVGGTLAEGVAAVAISGSLPPGAPADGIADLIRLAGRAGVPAFVDVHGPPLRVALAAGPDVVKVNASEAAEAAATADATATAGEQAPTDPGALAEALRMAGARVAIVTLGREGAVAAVGDSILRIEPPSRSGPYPVASGDAFLAGLATARLRAEGWEIALRLAAGAAAANALVPGQAVFDPDVARETAQEIAVNRIG